MELTKILLRQVVDHFMQMVYKKAGKVGCARGGLYGEPWYVVHYDKAPTPGQPSTTMNINKPKQVIQSYETFTVVHNVYALGKLFGSRNR